MHGIETLAAQGGESDGRFYQEFWLSSQDFSCGGPGILSNVEFVMTILSSLHS